MLLAKMPYDAQRAFTPITLAASAGMMLVAHPSLGVSNARELVALAKANPGKLTYGSPGIGSGLHLSGELFRREAGIDIVHVPYKGFGQTTQALLGGEVQLAFITLQAAKGMITGGRVRILALGEEARSDVMPGVPALSELIPGFKKSPQWHAIMGPPGMPRERVMRINTTGVWNCCQAVIPVMKQQARGAIVNLSSVLVAGFSSWGRGPQSAPHEVTSAPIRASTTRKTSAGAPPSARAVGAVQASASAAPRTRPGDRGVKASG